MSRSFSASRDFLAVDPLLHRYGATRTSSLHQIMTELDSRLWTARSDLKQCHQDSSDETRANQWINLSAIDNCFSRC